MQSELETVNVRPTLFFNSYIDMLPFLHIELEAVDKITVYFKRRDRSLEECVVLNFNEKFNFPVQCKIETKSKTKNETKMYIFDYSKLEDNTDI